MKLESWNRFKTWNFSVRPSLMGGSTTFGHCGSTITIKIPTLEHVGKQFDEDALAFCTTRNAKTEEPLSFHIRAVDVITTCPSEVDLPSTILERQPKAIDLLDASTQKALDAVTEAATETAISGFVYWVSLLRWVTGFHPVCREVRVGNRSGWSTYLHDSNTNHPVWASTQIYVVPADHSVTHEEWQQMQAHAATGTQAPLHTVLLHDAKHCMDVDDFRRALVDLCMACEVYLRTTVVDALPTGVQKEAVRLIEEANINQFISHLFPALLAEGAREPYKNSIKKVLSALFDKRNKLMHVASQDGVNRETCEKYLEAVDALFRLELRDNP